MKKYLLTLTMVSALCFIGKAQVGINQDNPKADLDINAAATPTYAEGLLLPKVSIDNLNGISNRYTDKQDGILVNVDTAPRDPITDPTLPTDKINKKGFYYYNAQTKMWEGFNANLGNGSFTPTKVYEIPITQVHDPLDWEQIQKTGANYFEFIPPNELGGASYNMPKPSIFANQTIYIRNNSGNSVNFEFKDVDFPEQEIKDPISGEIKKIDNIGLGNGKLTFDIHGTGAYQLYSNGERWIPMSFTDSW